MIIDNIEKIDLIALVASDLGTGEDTGKWTKFTCPFCNGIRRDARKFLLVTNGDDTRRGWWICKKCHRRGDAVDWLKDKRHYSYQHAVTFLRTVPYKNVREAVTTAE